MLRDHHPVLFFEYSYPLFTGAHADDVHKTLCLAALVGGYACTRPPDAAHAGDTAFCVKSGE